MKGQPTTVERDPSAPPYVRRSRRPIAGRSSKSATSSRPPESKTAKLLVFLADGKPVAA